MELECQLSDAAQAETDVNPDEIVFQAKWQTLVAKSLARSPAEGKCVIRKYQTVKNGDWAGIFQLYFCTEGLATAL